MLIRLLTLVVAAVLSLPAIAHAATITFVGTLGTPVAPAIEGNFIYDTFSGGLYRDLDGNGGGNDMEGCSVCGGGVLRLVRNDVAGGLFTFDGSDVMFQFGQAYNIRFEGYLLGALQGTDQFLTTSNSTWSTYASSVLSGVQLDELRVYLDATSATATAIDNLRVTESVAAVPEPGTLLLVGGGAAALFRRSRQRRS
jgi:hypothetical protein